MSTHNMHVCFHREIRKSKYFSVDKVPDLELCLFRRFGISSV